MSPWFVIDSVVKFLDVECPLQYIIANLGLSTNFGPISDNLVFPTWMLVDYIRVYQPPNEINIGCDPEGYPTQDYINSYVLCGLPSLLVSH